MWAWLTALLLTLSLVTPTLARADVSAQVDALQLERTDDGLYLSTTVGFKLPDVVQDALLRGVAIVFVAQAEVLRGRWYWTDERMATSARHMRLAYQPLTRRWRVHVAPNAIGSGGVALGQNFDSLEEALASVQRLSRWKIAETADLGSANNLSVQFSYQLDLSQLPRPLQIGLIGLAGQDEWSIAVTARQRLPVEASR